PETIDDSLLDALSPGSLLRYSRTCKTAHSIVQDYMKRAFRVDRLLSRYFTPAEIIRFRELQHLTGALISGSTAVQFFDRDTYPDSDLDVYVEHRFVRTLTNWLVKIGYKYTPLSDSADMATLNAAFAANPPEQEPTPHPGAISIFAGQDYFKSSLVLNFEKRHPQRTIQLITSLICPLQCILDFHSTCVMNVIAHDKAYSFFPKATFEERRSLRCYREGDGNRDAAAHKYTLRGWSMINESSIRKQVQNVFLFDKRHVGDRACWTLRVHPALELPDSFVEGNSWSMVLSRNALPFMKTTVMAVRELKFRYTLSPQEARLVRVHFWHHMLSLNEASDGTRYFAIYCCGVVLHADRKSSDMDAFFLRTLKKYRGDKVDGPENPGGHPKSG
ncbi:hypothetical protein HYPSUDRAFT_136540, partial [Hypholoma sublateritium FD-334 SS-4]